MVPRPAILECPGLVRAAPVCRRSPSLTRHGSMLSRPPGSRSPGHSDPSAPRTSPTSPPPRGSTHGSPLPLTGPASRNDRRPGSTRHAGPAHPSASPLRATSWEKAPIAQALPTTWLVGLYQGGTLVLSARVNRSGTTLQAGVDPTPATSGSRPPRRRRRPESVG